MDDKVERPLTARFSELRQGRIPIDEAVSDPEYFEAEREGIFKKVWVLVGRACEVPESNDYMVRDLPTLQTSVLLTRNSAGELRAFHNVCAHRGMTLCGRNDTRGSKQYFTCPFHAWVYDCDGELVGVPDRTLFDPEDLQGLHLKSISVDVWEGFVFINLAPEPSQTLSDFLGELNDAYRGYFDDQKFKIVNRYIGDNHMNWKFYVDSSVEAYHAGNVHLQNNTGQNQQSGTALYVPPSSVRLYDLHRSIGVPQGVGERELSPIEALSFRYGATTPYDPQSAGADMPPGINVDNDPNWAFDILEIFPNSILFLSAPFYAVISLWPSSVNRCRYIADIYAAPPENAAARVALEYGLVSLRDVLREDLNTAEGVTSLTGSHAVSAYTFSDQEIAVRHNYLVVDRMVPAWRKAGAA